MIVGIDPGWSSFGICVREPDINQVTYHNFIPKDLPSFISIVKLLEETYPSFLNSEFKNNQIFIERFVPYNNVQSGAAEDTLMVIGMLRHYFESKGSSVFLYRAIDWKSKLCKWMVRNKSFSNPSKGFDKVFSVAAAKCLLESEGFTFKGSTHEADAICLSYLTFICKGSK